MTENKVVTPVDVEELTRAVPVVSLAEALNAVPDPRHTRGKRHNLGSILCLAVCAMLCGAQSQYAVAQWGQDQGVRIGLALGFRKGKTPCVATLHRIFTAMDVERFEEVLVVWPARVVSGGSDSH